MDGAQPADRCFHEQRYGGRCAPSAAQPHPARDQRALTTDAPDAISRSTRGGFAHWRNPSAVPSLRVRCRDTRIVVLTNDATGGAWVGWRLPRRALCRVPTGTRPRCAAVRGWADRPSREGRHGRGAQRAPRLRVRPDRVRWRKRGARGGAEDAEGSPFADGDRCRSVPIGGEVLRRLVWSGDQSPHGLRYGTPRSSRCCGTRLGGSKPSRASLQGT